MCPGTAFGPFTFTIFRVWSSIDGVVLTSLGGSIPTGRAPREGLAEARAYAASASLCLLVGSRVATRATSFSSAATGCFDCDMAPSGITCLFGSCLATTALAYSTASFSRLWGCAGKDAETGCWVATCIKVGARGGQTGVIATATRAWHQLLDWLHILLFKALFNSSKTHTKLVDQKQLFILLQQKSPPSSQAGKDLMYSLQIS